MTQRERLATEAVSEPVSLPTGTPVPRPHPTLPASGGPAPGWDEYFRNVSPAQQIELLALAERQGILYQHQLPPTNGAGSDRTRYLFTQWLAGQTKDLEPGRHVTVAWVDAELDDMQREAVVRALSTPDICVLQGLPGSGKSRVAAEIVTQAAQRGQQVLLLGASAAAIDRVLGQVVARPTLCPIRCLSRGERVENLPPALRPLVFSERLAQLTTRALDDARRDVAQAEQQARRLRQDDENLERFADLVDQCPRLEEQLRVLERERDQSPRQVARLAEELETAAPADGDDFQAALAVHAADGQLVRHQLEEKRSQVSQRIAERRQALDDLLPQVAQVTPLVDAKKQGQWWTWTWWQATLQGNKVTAQMADLEARRQAIETALVQLEADERHVAQEQEQAELTYRGSRAAMCQRETDRRQEHCAQRLAALQRERDVVLEKWQRLAGDLDPQTTPPAERTREAVQAAREACRAQVQHEEQRAAFAREWTATLEKNASHGPAWLARHVNLVAATTAALGQDEHFGDGTGRTFDLLVLEDAHLLTETELLQVARRARRWVLIGQPAGEADSAARDRTPPRREASAAGRSASLTRLRPDASRPRPFQRLWDALHCDPRRLPYTWSQEDGRWCCRLQSFAPEQRPQLECERVADCPDIELRILALPRLAPTLAEVVFPPSMSIAQAKQYIYRELQELPVQALGHSFCWSEEPARLVLRLSDMPAAGAVPVTLESGICETVGLASADANGTGPRPAGHTCCLEFDRAAGWDRPRAEEWLQRHIGIRDLGRTVRLDVPHRMHADLAAVVFDLLGVEFGRLARPAPATDKVRTGGGPAPVEFVPVPPLVNDAETRRRGDPERNKTENGRRAAPPRLRIGKGGAGLELDLADPRQRERLPADLRPLLPGQGWVNLIEAQAVVGYLEKLAGAGKSGEVLPVGVVAMQPAQVALLRCLVQKSAALSASPLSVFVGDPAAFREREFPIMLLGLTRSHSHRAVSLADGLPNLTLVLTRARFKLILFGDPGTLARRSQWDGPVDHLDETAAARERDLVTRLVRYLHGEGAHPQAFHLREGKCT